MIAVVDYGVGNLFSLNAALAKLGADAKITRDPQALKDARGIILPGVGAFEDAAKKLRDLNLSEPLRENAKNGKPLLGICLGMQLLFEQSLEYGEWDGLSLLSGRVTPLSARCKPGTRIPHIGWNALHKVRSGCPLLSNTPEGAFFYYVHSFAAEDNVPSLAAESEYEGARVPGVVWRGNVFGTQFHPEKSGKAGFAMLKAFLAEAGEKT